MALGIIRVILASGFVAFPIATLSIEEEAFEVWIFAPAPAHVDTPNGGSMAIGELKERLTCGTDNLACLDLCDMVCQAKAHACAQLIAHPCALFFVGVDAVAAFGSDVLHAHERLQGAI